MRSTHIGQSPCFIIANHGAAYGRVFLALLVPDDETNLVAHLLDEVGYPWHDETANPAVALFLSERPTMWSDFIVAGQVSIIYLCDKAAAAPQL